jgi:exodeoxyribonuclease V gamma subunit
MLKVIRSERVEQLADVLAAEVAADLDGLDPFVPYPVAVGSPGMARWLRDRLTDALGVAAHISFPRLQKVVDELAARVATAQDPQGDSARPLLARVGASWAGPGLSLRVLAAVRRLASSDDPRFEEVRGHLLTRLGDPVSGREAGFAVEAARAISRLVTQRPEQALAWLSGETSGEAPWLPALLRALHDEVSAGVQPSPALLHRGLVETAPGHGGLVLPRGFSASESALPPARGDRSATLHVFGLSTIGPAERDQLTLLAGWFDVQVHILVPSPHWFGDTPQRHEVRRARRLAVSGLAPRGGGERRRALEAADATLAALGESNPIIAAFGGPGRDLQRWILDQEEAGALTEWTLEGVERDTPKCALHAIQGWISAGTPTCEHALVPDDSLLLHAGFGALRQCEALRDALLDRLERDPSLSPRDILVMTPDVETYGPLVAAVLTRAAPGGPPALTVHLADRGLRTLNPVADQLMFALTLAGERVTASALVDFLGRPATRERFGIAAEDLGELKRLVAESGMRWAWEADDRARHGQPAAPGHTVRFALERLAAGALLPELGPTEVLDVGGTDLSPVPLRNSERMRRFGLLASVCKALEASCSGLREPATVADWVSRLEQAARLLSPEGSARGEALAALASSLEGGREGTLASEAAGALLTREAVTRLLEAQLGERNAGDRRITGAVTVCALEPMRSVPFRVVALVGMDEGAFPRATGAPSWDPMATPREGELARRDVDRHLMLEAILSARDALMVFWTGFEAKRSKPLLASGVVEELIDAIAAGTGTRPAEARARWVRVGALQPWHAGAFAQGSYDGAMNAAGQALREAGRGGPRALAGLGGSTLEPLAPELATARRLDADELADAVARPLKQLLGGRLRLPLEQREDALSDREPIELDSLEAWRVRDALLAAALAAEGGDGATAGAVSRRLAADGLLPHAEGGAGALRKARATVARTLEALSGRDLGPDLPRSWRSRSGVELHGQAPLRVVSREAAGPPLWLGWVSSVETRPRELMRVWVNVLLAAACGLEGLAGGLRVGPEGSTKAKVTSLVAPGREEATALLEDLLAVRDLARARPLPLFERLSKLLGGPADAAPTKGQTLTQKARKMWAEDREDAWTGSIFGELDLGEVLRLGAPEAHDGLPQDLGAVALARRVWGPLNASCRADANLGGE